MAKNKVILKPDKWMVEHIATIPEVRDAVREEAGEIYWKAVAILARHRDTGAAHIEIDTPNSYPHWGINIWLVDEAALSIEFGHFTKKHGFPRYVGGLHVLRKAAGVM